jgi:broad specificity phosphatase PhoE
MVIPPPLLFIVSDTETMIEWYQMKPRVWSHLDELFAGSCDGLTYEQIEEMFPQEFALRQSDKLAYRYPRGESYLDVIARLEPIIIEMERHREPLLIIGHQGILRIIYAFYMGLSRAEAPYVSIHLNTVYEMVPTAYHCAVNIHTLYVPPQVLASDGQDEPTSGGHPSYRPKSFAQDDPPSH